MLPTAGAITVIAPFPTVLVRAFGTKLTVAGGLLVIAGSLWQISASSTATTYAGILPRLIMLGVGVGLTIPSATEPVMAPCSAGRPAPLPHHQTCGPASGGSSSRRVETLPGLA